VHGDIHGAALPDQIDVTDRAPVDPKLVEDLCPRAWHHSEQYGNNRIEADHGQLKRRLRPMRHLRNDRTAFDLCCVRQRSRTDDLAWSGL
jgi:transposase-like protein